MGLDKEMNCDNAKCGREIDNKAGYFIAKEIPSYGFSRIMQTLWASHKTFCSRDCLLAYLRVGGEL